MSTWEDLFAAEAAAPAPTEESFEAPKEVYAQVGEAMRTATEVVARIGSSYNSDGPEPPPTVLRLRHISGEAEVDVVRARTGWRWCGLHQPSSDQAAQQGWSWDRVHQHRPGVWQATELVEADDKVDVEVTYQFSGPEPPPGVVRLCVPEDYRHVARCPDGGWWMVAASDGDVPKSGWAWKSRERRKLVMKPVYPLMDPDTSEAETMLDSLIAALPCDEEWYRIATDKDTGSPIWAWSDGDDSDVYVGERV